MAAEPTEEGALAVVRPSRPGAVWQASGMNLGVGRIVLLVSIEMSEPGPYVLPTGGEATADDDWLTSRLGNIGKCFTFWVSSGDPRVTSSMCTRQLTGSCGGVDGGVSLLDDKIGRDPNGHRRLVWLRGTHFIIMHRHHRPSRIGFNPTGE